MSYKTDIDKDEGHKEYLNTILDNFEHGVYKDTKDNFDKRSSVTIRGGRPYSYSPREIGEQMVKHFRSCVENNKPFTISGLCLLLGVTREGVRKMENSSNYELVVMIKKGKYMVEFYWEYAGQIMPNPSFAIFVLKNMGWREKQTIDTRVSVGMSYEERKIAQERLRKIYEH